jgi:hypothetical protein
MDSERAVVPCGHEPAAAVNGRRDGGDVADVEPGVAGGLEPDQGRALG